ncbi:MAG: YARHG domain-containing protein [Prevotella sp.]|nr:YARHG domain-containing protein [Prevotella sp.]
MKKVLFVLITVLLCLFTTLGVQAQIAGGNWYNGWLVYSADQQAGGKIVMNAMAEGEEHEFVLVPVEGKKDTYRVTDGTNHYVNEYGNISTVRHLRQGRLDVLCFYNQKSQLEAVMSKESEWDAEKINKKRWLGHFYGNYTSAKDDLQMSWDAYNITADDVASSFEVVTFNGLVMGYVTVAPAKEGTHRLEGTWEVEPTLEGITLHSAAFDSEAFMWVRDGIDISLKRTIYDDGRFPFTSQILLNTQTLGKYDKKTLRIMRNEILARHGYRFQSKDLQEYFGKQSWYHPAASNDQVKPTFLEQLNIDLIKSAENSK